MKIAVCDDNSKELLAIGKIIDEDISNNSLKYDYMYDLSKWNGFSGLHR